MQIAREIMYTVTALLNITYTHASNDSLGQQTYARYLALITIYVASHGSRSPAVHSKQID